MRTNKVFMTVVLSLACAVAAATQGDAATPREGSADAVNFKRSAQNVDLGKIMNESIVSASAPQTGTVASMLRAIAGKTYSGSCGSVAPLSCGDGQTNFTIVGAPDGLSAFVALNIVRVGNAATGNSPSRPYTDKMSYNLSYTYTPVFNTNPFGGDAYSSYGNNVTIKPDSIVCQHDGMEKYLTYDQVLAGETTLHRWYLGVDTYVAAKTFWIPLPYPLGCDGAP